MLNFKQDLVDVAKFRHILLFFPFSHNFIGIGEKVGKLGAGTAARLSYQPIILG
jgi:hypothetical protein